MISKAIEKLFLGLISFYKRFFSFPLVLLFGGGCRFTPTCSQYAQDSIRKYGLVKGLILSFRRVLRCHPFSKADFYDPVS